MRWDEQRVENDLRLPGVGDGTVVRTFDAPEAMGIDFYEVRARSALNHVPGDRFGFGWTINPYRGCTHACVYCLAGETPILMADGSTRPIAELAVGDEIYGTVRRGAGRRYERTRVEAHWATRKRAHRVALADGTELIASGDHRFLAERGWRHLTGTERDAGRRPFLEAGEVLLGPARRAVADDSLVEAGVERRVAAIEPLDREIEMFDITTGSGDFIADGVISHNCFARKTHTYLDLNPGEDFQRKIVVKVNLPEVVRAELGRASWRRELVALGTNTDPYQWVESRYRMLPEILAALEEAETPVSVLTKSPLVMRDVEIFERMRDRGLKVSVNLSVPTLDEAAWRATEPHTPSPAARLDAVAELRRRGIDSGVLIAPLMPGINDSPEQVEPIVERAREADASFLGGVALHLRGEVKDVFFGWLAAKRPDLVPKYEALYGPRAYLRPEQRRHATRALKTWGDPRMRSSRAPASSSSQPSGASPRTGSSSAASRAGGGGEGPGRVSPGVSPPTGPARHHPTDEPARQTRLF